MVFLEIGDINQANQHIKQGKEIITGKSFTFQRPYFKLLEGICHRLCGKYEKARDCFRVSESQFKSLGLKNELAQTHLEWAELELEQEDGDTKEKAHFFGHPQSLIDSAISLGRKIGSNDIQIHGLILLAKIDDKNAPTHLDQSQALAEACGLKNYLWRIHLSRANLGMKGIISLGEKAEIAKNLRHARRILDEVSIGLEEELKGVFWADYRHRLRPGMVPSSTHPKESTSLSPSAQELLDSPEKLNEMTVRFRNEALSRGIEQLTDLFQINMMLNSPMAPG